MDSRGCESENGQGVSLDILASISEQTADSVLVTNREGVIKYVNPSFEKLTGFSKQEILGKTPAVLKSGCHPAEFYTQLWKTILEGNPYKDVLVNRKKSGELYYTEKTITPIRDGEVITHFVSTDRDITQVRHNEEALKKYAEELERSNRDLEQFAYFASHDLQEPIRTVVSFLQLLRMKMDSIPPEAEEYLQFAVDGSKRMQELVLNLLRYSRAGQKLHIAPVDMNEIFADAVSNLSLNIKENDAVVDAEPLPKLQGDRVQLLQLLQNLLANGLKYRSTERPRIHVGATQKDQEWIFSVKDNGLGIEEDYQKKVFGLFTRIPRDTHKMGCGMGLALCQRVVTRHGGRIWLESKLNHGSTFYFSLPLIPPTEARP